MGNSSIRTCKCCGKTYKFCNHCDNAAKTPWKNICDTEKCRDILNIVSAYNMGKATKDTVKKVLKDNNVTDYSQFVPSIAEKLTALFKEEPKSVAATPTEPKKVNRRKKKKPVDVEFDQKG